MTPMRTGAVNKESPALRLKLLEDEMEIKNKESSLIVSECTKLKELLTEEKEKRRKVEHEKRELAK